MEPFHDGERAVQARFGLAQRMDGIGRRVIRDHLPEQHRAFYESLPFLVVGTVDTDGWPQASLWTGEPGFVSSPDPARLVIRGARDPDDPVAAALDLGRAIGILGIELHTRRRNRASGHISARSGDTLSVAVDQTVGNCPQYITPRTPEARPVERGELRRFSGMDPEIIAWISGADTCFLASVASADGRPGPGAAGADVSHRGGPAGFVRVEGDTLVMPDYPGNNLYMTLGNLELVPRVGVVFVDFARGDLLHVHAEAVMDWEARELRMRVVGGVVRKGALGLRWV